jgi:hypothetical protein
MAKPFYFCFRGGYCRPLINVGYSRQELSLFHVGLGSIHVRQLLLIRLTDRVNGRVSVGCYTAINCIGRKESNWELIRWEKRTESPNSMVILYPVILYFYLLFELTTGSRERVFFHKDSPLPSIYYSSSDPEPKRLILFYTDVIRSYAFILICVCVNLGIYYGYQGCQTSRFQVKCSTHFAR